MVQVRMLATIFLKLLLFLTVFELASAFIAGHRVYGTRFSLALPRITSVNGVLATDTKYCGRFDLMTEDERSTVTVMYPKHSLDQSKGYRYHTFRLNKNKHAHVYIKKRNSFPENLGTGVYNTVKITSTSPIRIILNRYNNNENHDSADFHNVMPLESCSTSYYVSTGLGHAFLMVMTFDSKVNARVTFPRTGHKFIFACHAETHSQTWCKEDSSILVTLGNNKAWYVEQEKGARFLNTLIETDKPVFVIAGNKDLERNGTALDDVVVTSIYPTEAWGKEYVVSRFAPLNSDQHNLVLQFNAKKLPFKFKTFDGVKYTSDVISSFDSYFTIRNSRGFYIILADVPFGLYQIFGLQGQNFRKNDCVATIVNLIPTEQWSNGVVIRMPEDEHRYFYKCFTSATKKGYVLFGSGQNKVIWRPGHIRYNKHFYYVGKFKIKPGSATFFTKDPLARMIVYNFKQSHDYSSCSGTAVDFYQASIHQEDCSKNSNIVTNDGVDNDCDGRVDEEIKDEKDNDGYGEIDEDLVGKNRDSVWMGWKKPCYFTWGGDASPLLFRACERTRFGHYCRGPFVMCTPNLPYLPWECGGKFYEPKKCKCSKGCNNKCQKNENSCPNCIAGFYNEKFCMRRCPKGFEGIGCSQWPLPNYPAKRWVPRKPDDYWTNNDVFNNSNSHSNDNLGTSNNQLESSDGHSGGSSQKDSGSNDDDTVEGDTSDKPSGSYTTNATINDTPSFWGDDLSEESVVFIALGILLLLLVILVAICCCITRARRNRKRREKGNKKEDGSMAGDNTSEDEMSVATSLGESSVDTTSVASSDWQTSDYSPVESEL